MNIDELIKKISLLIEKYIPDRLDLIQLIQRDSGCVKYVLAELDRHKTKNYDAEDLELIKDIFFYWC